MHSTHKINLFFVIKFCLTDILCLIMCPQCCCLLGTFLEASCLRKYRMCDSLKLPNVAGNNVVNRVTACESDPLSKASCRAMDRSASLHALYIKKATSKVPGGRPGRRRMGTISRTSTELTIWETNWRQKPSLSARCKACCRRRMASSEGKVGKKECKENIAVGRKGRGK